MPTAWAGLSEGGGGRAGGGGGSLSARRLGDALSGAREPALVAEDADGLGEIERAVGGIGRDGDDGLAAIELVVGEPPVLPAGDQRHRSARASRGEPGGGPAGRVG